MTPACRPRYRSPMKRPIAATLLSLATAVACAAQPAAAPPPALTPHGAMVEPLIESYLMDAGGAPLPGENAWPILASAAP